MAHPNADLLKETPLLCPATGLPFGDKRIQPHYLRGRVCRTRTSFYALCPLHSVRVFVADPFIFKEFIDAEDHEA